MAEEKTRSNQTTIPGFFVKADFRTLGASAVLIIGWLLIFLLILRTPNLSKQLQDMKTLIGFIALTAVVTFFVIWNFLRTERTSLFMDVDHMIIHSFPGVTVDVPVSEIKKCRLGFKERGLVTSKNRTNVTIYWKKHSLTFGLHENTNVDTLVEALDECGVPFEATWGGKPSVRLDQRLAEGTPILEFLYQEDMKGMQNGIHL